MKNQMRTRLLAALALILMSFHLPAAESHLVLISSVETNYDAAGNAIAGGASQSLDNQHHDGLRTTSSGFFNSFVGDNFTYYDTNVSTFSKNPSQVDIVDDYLTLSNGLPFEQLHSASIFIFSTNGSTGMVDRIWTPAGGSPVETITTSASEVSTNFNRAFEEVRDVSGDLISWNVNAWTNDPLHFQQIYFTQFGGTNESDPNFISIVTNTVDSYGNVILSVSYEDSYGYVFTDTGSNSYTLDSNGRPLVEVSTTDSGSDGTIDFTSVTTFKYDKAGNLVLSDSKSYGADGVFEGETVETYSFDKFGDLLSQETTSLDVNGNIVSRAVSANTWVPRGQSFERPAGLHGRKWQNPKRGQQLLPGLELPGQGMIR
jgi:hypothetical protein